MGVALKYQFVDRIFQRAHVRQTTFGRLGMPKGVGNFVTEMVCTKYQWELYI